MMIVHPRKEFDNDTSQFYERFGPTEKMSDATVADVPSKYEQHISSGKVQVLNVLFVKNNFGYVLRGGNNYDAEAVNILKNMLGTIEFTK